MTINTSNHYKKEKKKKKINGWKMYGKQKRQNGDQRCNAKAEITQTASSVTILSYIFFLIKQFEAVSKFFFFSFKKKISDCLNHRLAGRAPECVQWSKILIYYICIYIYISCV